MQVDVRRLQMLAEFRGALERIQEAGGEAYLVGGAVRDLLLGVPVHDLDFEVYSLDVRALERALDPEGEVCTVGRAFGVTKLRVPSGAVADFAIPRREVPVGRGHRDLAVSVDPDLGKMAACARRDFTWNAMLLDPKTGEVIDFFGGVRDLTSRVIRQVSDHFVEDPLRPLRAVQFAARFRMQVAPETAALCRGMVAGAGALSADRMWGEWRKWAEAPYPDEGLRVLREIGWSAVYPALDRLWDTPQDRRFHPEGDVGEHTVRAVAAAARIAVAEGVTGVDRHELLLAALLHDVGKVSTTVVQPDGSVTAQDHAEVGAASAQTFMEEIGVPGEMVPRVVALVREHMAHMGCSVPSKRVVRRLAQRLHPASILQLDRVARADQAARGAGGSPFGMHLLMAEELAVQGQAPAPLLQGRDLLALGMQPGPAMGRLLAEAHEAFLDGQFEDVVGARAWVSERMQESVDKHKPVR